MDGSHHERSSEMLASQRALFDIPRDVCYLNAASCSPLPLQDAGSRPRRGRAQGQALDAPASFANEQYERTRDRRGAADQRRA